MIRVGAELTNREYVIKLLNEATRLEVKVENLQKEVSDFTKKVGELVEPAERAKFPTK